MPSGRDMRHVETVTGAHPLLFGLSFEPCRWMAGMRKAVQVGDGPVCVSPAMYELIFKAESQHELRQVLENIPLLRLPKLDQGRGAWEMTTTFNGGG